MAWQRPTDLRGWMNIILRHRKKMFFPALTVMIGVLWFSTTLDREYQATAKFQRVVQSPMAAVGGGVVGRSLRNTRATLLQNIRGRSAIEQVVHDLRLDARYKFPRGPDGVLTDEGQRLQYDLVRRLSSRLTVAYEVQTDDNDTIAVTYADRDRDLVPLVANQVVENFMRRTSEVWSKDLADQTRFYRNEIDRAKGRLRELQEKKLRMQRDFPPLENEGPSSISQQAIDARDRLGAARDDLEARMAERAELERNLREMPEFITITKTVENPKRAALDKVLADYQRLLEEFRARDMTDEHPRVKDVLRRLAAVHTEIEQLPRQTESEGEQVPNMEKHAAAKQLRTLNVSIAGLEKRVGDLTTKAAKAQELDNQYFNLRAELTDLKSEIEYASNQARFWEDNERRIRNAVRTETEGMGQNLQWLQRASDTDVLRPSKPNLGTIVSIALMLGLATAAVVLLLAELLDHTYHSVEQAVDNLKLPVLGAINEISTPAVVLRRRILSLGVYPLAALLLILLLGASYLAVILSLNNPKEFGQFMADPARMVRQGLTGGRT